MGKNNQINPDELTTILGKGTEFEGKLNYRGTVRIDGRFSGEIFTEDGLLIGEGAEVKAEIHCGLITIRGRVVGSIQAQKRVELLAPGCMVGDLHTPAIHIQEGAVFDGTCVMSGDGQTSLPGGPGEPRT